ncbi:MAG TPA: FAD-binding protein, partial [Acidimicrobiales bacterium]
MSVGPIDIAGLDGGTVALSPEQMDELARQVDGPILRPGDEGWAEAVLIWNGMVAKVPALVLQPTSTADVAAAVRFAADHGLLLGIKGGGHNIAGTGVAAGGLNLDMSRLRD